MEYPGKKKKKKTNTKYKENALQKRGQKARREEWRQKDGSEKRSDPCNTGSEQQSNVFQPGCVHLLNRSPVHLVQRHNLEHSVRTQTGKVAGISSL